MKTITALLCVLLSAILPLAAQSIFDTPDPSLDEAIHHLTSKINEYCTFYLPGTTILNQEWKVVDYKDGVLTISSKFQYDAPNGMANSLSSTYQIPLAKMSSDIGGFSRSDNDHTIVLATADGSEGVSVSGHSEDRTSKGTQARDTQGHSVKFAIECHSAQQAEELKRAFSRVMNFINPKPGDTGDIFQKK